MPFVGVPIEIPPPPLPPAPYQLPTVTLSRNGDNLHLPFTATPGHIWCIGPGSEGFDLPASSLFQQRAAGQYGSYARGVDVPAREVFMPLMVSRHEGYQTMLEERDLYNKLTSPYSGIPTRITFSRPDGSQRWIEGYRVGDAPSWDRGTWWPQISWQKFGQLFVCPDPWWHSFNTTAVTWTGPDSSEFFPITPVNLSSSQIIGDPRVVNISGDVIAYPLFELCGPMTSITATHIETGRFWTLNASLAGEDSGIEQECATVNTDPRAAATGPAIQGPDGSSWFEFLEPPYDLWSLPPGDQTIQLEVVGAGPGTRIRMIITDLWETA